MREFQEKKRVKHILYSRTSVVILFFLILFFANAAWKVYEKERESAANAVRAQNELQRLKDREQVLTREIARLSTDQGIEEEIRSKYSVSKKGEQLLVIIDKEKATTTPEEAPQGWWQRFLSWFK